MAKENVVHPQGHPFHGIQSGDTVQVIYDGTQAALVKISRVKNFALMGTDGKHSCKITTVTPTDLRFYANLSEKQTSVLRPIGIKKL